MAKVKLGLNNLTVSEFILKVQFIISSMTGNGNFPTPEPPLADVQTNLDALIVLTEQAANRDKVKVALRKEQHKVVEGMCVQLAAYVQSASKGDLDKILSSGFEVIERGGPVGLLPAPQDLRVKSEQGFSGQLRLEWKRVHGASSYIVQQTTANPADPDSPWTDVGHPQKSKYTAEGLTPGTVYSFRVIAVGADGLGAASTAVSQMAV